MSQDMLERELARRAEDVHGAPLSFADVRGKAVSIRRRRRASVAGAVAAVVALVVIVPTALSGDTTKSDDVDPAPPRPVTGAILEDGLVTLPGDEELPVDLAAADAQTRVVLDDGQVVVARNNPTRIDVYTPDGERRDYPVRFTHVVGSANGDAAAWIEEDGTVQVLASGEAEPAALGQVGGGRFTDPMIDAVLGPDRVLVGDGSTTSTEVTADGVTPFEAGQPLRVTGASADGSRWTVQTREDPNSQFGCWSSYDPAAEQMLAESCETASLRFSPDGRHLTGALGDGGSWGSVEVFDAELREVFRFDPPGRQVVTDWAWADDDTLRVVVVDTSSDPQWSVVLVPIDGGPSTVEVGPVPGEFPEPGFQTFSLSD